MFVRFVTINTCRSNDIGATIKFSKQLAKEDPSPIVFAYQEVDINAQRSDRINAAARLAGVNEYFFSPSIRFDAAKNKPAPPPDNSKTFWEYGLLLTLANAKHSLKIKSRFVIPLGPPEQDYWRHANSTDERTRILRRENEPRVALMANIGNSKTNFWVINTHMAHTPDRTASSEVRKEQVNILFAAINKHIPRNSKIILMGDFNSTLNNPDMEHFKRYFIPCHNHKMTYKNERGYEAQIDHIFYRIKPKQRIAAKTRGLKFSDHKALIAKMDIR